MGNTESYESRGIPSMTGIGVKYSFLRFRVFLPRRTGPDESSVCCLRPKFESREINFSDPKIIDDEIRESDPSLQNYRRPHLREL